MDNLYLVDFQYKTEERVMDFLTSNFLKELEKQNICSTAIDIIALEFDSAWDMRDVLKIINKYTAKPSNQIKGE